MIEVIRQPVSVETECEFCGARLRFSKADWCHASMPPLLGLRHCPIPYSAHIHCPLCGQFVLVGQPEKAAQA